MSARKRPPRTDRCARAGRARASLAVDDDARHLRPQREVQIRKRENEEDRAKGDERPEPRRVAAQVDVLEAEAAEPEQIREETDERAEEQRNEKKDDDDRGDDDRPPRRTRDAAAAPTEPRQVDVRPIDVSEVAPAVPAPSPIAHAASAYSASVRTLTGG